MEYTRHLKASGFVLGKARIDLQVLCRIVDLGDPKNANAVMVTADLRACLKRCGCLKREALAAAYLELGTVEPHTDRKLHG